MSKPIERLRSLLFAPAVRPDFLERLPERGADGVVIDCEDATPPNAKGEARRNAREIAPRIAGRGALVFVRVNAVSSAWFEDDLRDGLCDALTGIVVPKLERLDQLAAVEAGLEAAGLPRLAVLAGIETALGVEDARRLLTHPRVAAAYFGAEDFIADMGGVRTVAGQEVLYARSRVALAGRLAGIPTLDQVVVDFRNEAAFRREVGEARAMGYRGKLCIHPGQVALANAGFVPSAEEVEHARRLLAAYAKAQAEGIAAIDFEGQMVDEPLASRARQTLAAAEAGEGGS
ncbi:MAG: CoA ester lyase [Spirochaetaceae bacterium]|nr:CoA ester lyase [Myxococcales bacterium]MCB9725105.1 CoA ester lyase [Spirochaetaceae bacterium]